MQGRSIGSKRFNVGEAAPQPTRASIYQEENTPLDWMAQDLRAQLANAQKPAAPQGRALRHGLIASQLGLPMLEHAQKKGLEDWEQPELAASSGEGAVLGLDWPNTEQTTRYDEWELQKELVTYEESDLSYDEHPRLDLDLPPIAPSYEPDFSPAHSSTPGSYAYARLDQETAQPSAARRQSPKPIRPSPQSPATQTGFPTHTRGAPQQGAIAPTARRMETGLTPNTPVRPRVTTQTGFTTHGGGATPRGAAHAGRRVTTQTGLTTNALGATPRGAAHAGRRVTTQTGFMNNALGAAQRGSADAGLPVEAQNSFTTDALTATPRAGASRVATSPGFARYARGAAGGAEPRTVTQASFVPHTLAQQANDGPGQVHGVQAGGAPHATHASAARLPRALQPGAAARKCSTTPRSAVLREDDDEPVVYPHRRGWLRRALVVLALSGGAYVAYPYVLQHAAAPTPAPPPPIAAASVVPELPPAPSIPVEPEQASEPESPTAAPLSEKERRKVERRALIAERLRERRAARLARSERSTGDEADRSSYASGSRSRERAGDDWSSRPSAASSTSAHDDYWSGRHATAQSGVLRINSLPWSEVHVDGQLVGHTPQMNLLLSAGKHRVTLVNREMQLSKSITVQITPGNTTTQMVNLAQ